MAFKKSVPVEDDPTKNQTPYRVKAMGLGPKMVQGSTFRHHTLGKYSDDEEGREAQDEHIRNLLAAGVIEEMTPVEAEQVEKESKGGVPATVVTPSGDAIPLDQPREQQQEFNQGGS